MVWMRRREGWLRRSQSRAFAEAGAALASSRRIPARMAAAALRVKVTARISSGSSTHSRRRRKRFVSTVVLPEPAGACSTTEIVGSIASARARASASSAARASLIGSLLEVVLIDKPALDDAAQAHHIAVLAGLRGRIHLCASQQKIAHERLDARAPELP